ncbi:STAS domain-containing protein [Paractinoplanes lichenicola]|uniref:STAS domain-containing protein n=1 Tax=Paractinoplanes lichenicola TaxID=2802976 RepID=A0ABS1VWZ2_9ACTN|nr:STAS domain-containing protein [Actinoplanes lichenicola]MBL7259011.1 STAS domain-containing protein [Actinoplanes lichenicola]
MSDPIFHVPLAPGEQAGIISLAGSLDSFAHDRVRAALGAALAWAAARHRAEVVVDVRAVRFIDAGTIRLLIETYEAAADAGRRLRLVGPSDAVRRAIEAAGAGHRLLPRTSESIDDEDPSMHLPDGAEDLARASAGRRRAENDQVRIRARIQQQAVDGEVRATRRTLLADLRERLRTDPRALADDNFLALADTDTVHTAILMAATIVGSADACELRLEDAASTVRLRGLAEPDDFATARSYPLRGADGRLIGVLAMHFRTDEPRVGRPELVVECAELALAVTDRLGRPAPLD